jgi:hypothetical protein
MILQESWMKADQAVLGGAELVNGIGVKESEPSVE